MRTTPKVAIYYVYWGGGGVNVVRKSHTEFFKKFNLFTFKILATFAFYKSFLL